MFVPPPQVVRVITASPVMYTADECYVWANTVDNVG